jgi:hypothetical protein
MTRRDFAELLPFMVFGVVRNDRTLRWSDIQASGFERHIEDLRLSDFIAGEILLDEWERDHVHHCGICQTKTCGFMQSLAEDANMFALSRRS